MCLHLHSVSSNTLCVSSDKELREKLSTHQICHIKICKPLKIVNLISFVRYQQDIIIIIIIIIITVLPLYVLC